jgi:hypothetical protein
LKDQGLDGRMGSKWTLGDWLGAVEWFHLAQDRDRWRAVVNAVMNLRVLLPRSYAHPVMQNMNIEVCNLKCDEDSISTQDV